MDWAGKAAAINSDSARKLLQCASASQVAKTQQELLEGATRIWMERSSAVLQIVQRTSKQALNPLQGRLEPTD